VWWAGVVVSVVLLVWRWCGGCRPAIPCRAVVASLAAGSGLERRRE
jgi:hypothetical protein